MTAQLVASQLPTFSGLEGINLTDGYVYFGVPNQDPRTSPVPVYFDQAKTIPAPQPLRTTGGYIYRTGAPAQVWIDGTYSMMVRDATDRQVLYLQKCPTSNTRNVINVKDAPFYAVGDGVTDDTAAIQAALNSVATGEAYSKTIYFPTGMYRITAGLTAPSRNIVFRGDGPRSSLLSVGANVTAIQFDATGCAGPDCGMQDMGVVESGAQPSMTAVSFKNSQDVFMQNVYITTSGRAWEIGDGVTFSRLNQVRAECYGGMEAIRHKGGGGVWSNVWVRKARIAGAVGPTFWITGTTTALNVSNSSFGGKGTAKSTPITAISAGAGFFDVGCPGNAFTPGEPMVILGTGTGYDRVWKVDSKPNTDTVRILQPDASLGNIAAPAAGSRADKLHACLYMDNSLGPVNETQWDNVLFEGIENGSWVGSCSVYANAAGSATAPIISHQFTGCTYDAGHNAIVLAGRNIGSGDTLMRDFRFTGGIVRYSVAAIWLLGAKGVHIDNFTGDAHRLDSSTAELNRSCGLFLDTTTGEPCSGIKVSNCTFGRAPDWTVAGIANFSPDYGLRVAGTIQDVHFTGIHFFGLTAATLFDNAGGLPDPTSRIVETGCTYASGLSGESTGTRIPTIASAATITLPPGDLFAITGTTTINTINGGWVGRTITLLVTSALSLSGGNMTRTAAIAAGTRVTLTFNGTVWCY